MERAERRQSAVGLICILGTNAIVRKLDPDSSLF